MMGQLTLGRSQHERYFDKGKYDLISLAFQSFLHELISSMVANAGIVDDNRKRLIFGKDNKEGEEVYKS